MKSEKLIFSKTLFTWLVSYMLILILPISLNFFTYLYAENILYKKINELNLENLRVAQSHIDNIINNSIKTTVELSYSKELMTVSEWDPPFSKEEIFYLYENLSSIWNGYAAVLPYIQNTYVYVPQSNHVFYKNASKCEDDFFKTFYNDNVISFSTWKEKVLLAKTARLITITNPNEDYNQIYYVLPRNEIGTEMVKMCLVVEFNTNLLVSSYDDSFYIRHNSGEIIASSLPSDYKEKIESFGQLRENQLNAKINNKNMVIAQIKSQSGDWSYGFIKPKSEYLKEATGMRIIMFAVTLLSIVLGFLLIVFSIKKNHKPIRELVSKLSSKDKKAPHPIDEYKYINDVIIKTINEKNDYASRLMTQNAVFKENVLINIIKGKTNEKFTFSQQLESVGIKWNGENFLVLLFYVDDLRNIFFEEYKDNDTAEKLKLAQVIVSNVVSEMINAHYLIQMCEINDLLVGIVNLTELHKPNAKENLKHILMEAQNFIKNEFNFSFLISCSDIHVSISGLPEAYQEAILGIEYLNLSENASDNIIDYSEITVKNTSDYAYSLEYEHQIINCIHANEYDKCIDIVDNVIERCLSASYTSIETVHYFAYDLLCTFLKIAINKKSENLESLLVFPDMHNSLIEDRTPRNILLKTREKIYNFIDEIKKSSNNESDNIISKIKIFVDKHYDNPNMNVAEVANVFQMNPSNLSFSFKQATSIGLLDYITKKRIDTAKKLLVTTSDPINKISVQVGYLSTRTFMRVFSKIEGISPGKYRQIKQSSDGDN